MRLTVLGSSASYASAGRACAGYLVSDGSASVLLDCGNGTIANLASVSDPLALGAVVITHEHIDHFADLYALQAALRYAPSGPVPALPLYLPAGLFERIGAVLNDHGRGELAEAFVVHELAAGVSFTVGGLTITPHQVDHVEPTFALRITDGACTLVYTSDTAPSRPAFEAAQGADVLLADATLPAEYAGHVPHLTAGQAGWLAHEANARVLVLTHLWPTVDREVARAEAQAAFEGRVIIAEELSVIDCEEG